MKKFVKKVNLTLLWIVTFLLGIVLSIVHANGWIIVPITCRVICWIFSILGYMLYSYVKGVFDSKPIQEIIEQNKTKG